MEDTNMQTSKILLKTLGVLLALAMVTALLPIPVATAQPELVGPALQAGADRLVEMQNPDGGWGWELIGNSAPNTVNPIGKGLAQAYLFTGDPDHLSALELAGLYLTTKTTLTPF
jgi:hypothetical protein